MKKGLLIILSGPSGVGKGTVRRQIVNKKMVDLVFSISMTTRSPRNKEVDGVDYFFVTRKEFEQRIQNNSFLEYAEFVGNYYGTPKDKVEEVRNQGRNVLLEIETNGAKQVMDNIKDEGVVSFFLVPPSLKALEERIRKRKTESEEVIQMRLEKGAKEMALSKNYDYVIINSRVDKAAKQIAGLIKKKMKDLK